MRSGHFLVWPNTVPFNAMLLTGKLPFKTRKSPPLHDYRGKVLFYNSSKHANQHKILGEGIDPKLMQMQTIVGEGHLIDVRTLTGIERDDFALRCKGIYGAFPLGYFFDNLVPYNNPIPANWPKGCVRGSWLEADPYEPWRHRAMIDGVYDWETNRIGLSSNVR